MKTLKDVFDDGGASSAPYTTALKVQICGIADIKNYRNANGEQRQSITVGFADHTMAVKGILYDVSKANVLRNGGTVMLLNVILKKDLKTLVMTNRSKVLKTGPFQQAVPEYFLKQGQDLACPPPAELVAINKIKMSPVKTMVSIRGQVVSEEMERKVKVAGEDTAVRTLKIKDQTAACKVSLWRDLSKIKTTVGQHIELTNVIVQVCQEEKSVSTTSRTKLVEIAAPEVVRKITVIAYDVIDGEFLTLTSDVADVEDEDYPEFEVPLPSLQKPLHAS